MKRFFLILTDRALASISERLGRRSAKAGFTLATAESCTGGFIAKVLTDIAGSSAWFQEGFVTYSNAAKEHRLGVPGHLLRRHGAVSEAVARAMAKGALRASGADAAVAVTGIAGPGGATAGKPVGTVWFAWAKRQGTKVQVRSLHKRFRGGRDTVRRKTVRIALLGFTR